MNPPDKNVFYVGAVLLIIIIFGCCFLGLVAYKAVTPTQYVTGGCFLSIGDGCNTSVYIDNSVGDGNFFDNPLVALGALAVSVFSLIFLYITRKV